MAWWDHEELKSPADRSDRYKEAFPQEYKGKDDPYFTSKNAKDWKKNVSQDKRYHEEVKQEYGKAMTDKEMFDSTPCDTEPKRDILKPWTKATEENWAGDVKYLYRNYGWDDTGSYPLPNNGELLDGYIRKKEQEETTKIQYPRPWPDKQKFKESQYHREIQDYVSSTYDEHYAQGKIQSFELIASKPEKADGFTTGSIMKYAARYGDKEGYNRKDLLKIIHYAMLQLWVHDNAGRK